MEDLTKEELINIIKQQSQIVDHCQKLISMLIVDISMNIENINRIRKALEETVIATDGGIAAQSPSNTTGSV